MTAHVSTPTLPADLAVVFGADAWISWVTAAMGAGLVPRAYMVPPHHDVLRLGRITSAVRRGDAVRLTVESRFRSTHGVGSEQHEGLAVLMLNPWLDGGTLRMGAEVEQLTVTEWHAWGLRTSNGQMARVAADALTEALEAHLVLSASTLVVQGDALGVAGPEVARLPPTVELPPIEGTALVAGDTALRRLVASLREERVDGQEVVKLRTRALEGGARGDLELADGRTLSVTTRWAPESLVPVVCEGDAVAVTALQHLVSLRLAAVGLDAVSGRWRLPLFRIDIDTLHAEAWELVGAPGAAAWSDGVLTVPLRVSAGRRRMPFPVSLVGVERGRDGLSGLTVVNEQGDQESMTLTWARSAVAAGAMAKVALPRALPATLDDGSSLSEADAEALRVAGIAQVA